MERRRPSYHKDEDNNNPLHPLWIFFSFLNNDDYSVSKWLLQGMQRRERGAADKEAKKSGDGAEKRSGKGEEDEFYL